MNEWMLLSIDRNYITVALEYRNIIKHTHTRNPDTNPKHQNRKKNLHNLCLIKKKENK